MKFTVLTVLFGFLFLAGKNATAKDIYIAQNQAGANTGAACSDAHSSSWFNSSSNWGSGTPQIGPGTTVHLCGLFTGSAGNGLLYVQGSGTNGSPIIILFETGAVLQSPYFNSDGAIDIGNNSYISIDGGTNGIIQNTANGTVLSNHVQTSSGIHSPYAASDLEVRNLTCRNIYVRTSTTDINLGGGPADNNCLRFDGGSNISVHDNIFHDAAWTIWYGMSSGAYTGFTAFNNEFYNFDHGIGFGEGGANGKTFTNLNIYNNHFHDPAAWDDTADSIGNQRYHHDGIHTFAYCSGQAICSQTSITTESIYSNLFDGNWGIGVSSYMFMEGTQTNVNFFNNIGLVASGVYVNNGIFDLNGTNLNIFNNTIIGSTTSAGYCLISNDGGGSSIKNNVIAGCQGLINPQSGSFSGGIDYNVYSNGGNQMFQWQGDAGTMNFATWKANSGGDAHGQVVSDLKLVNGVPAAGSPVIGAGANLTGLGIPALNSDFAGTPRPASGAWDAGAYASGTSAGLPSPPVSLSATAQ